MEGRSIVLDAEREREGMGARKTGGATMTDGVSRMQHAGLAKKSRAVYVQESRRTTYPNSFPFAFTVDRSNTYVCTYMFAFYYYYIYVYVYIYMYTVWYMYTFLLLLLY